MIEVNVWADVRCPWCWIGLRRLQRARATIDESVLVRRRSFLLEPQGPVSPGRATAQVATSEWAMSTAQWNAKSRLIRSEGSSEGLRIDMDGALMFDSNPVHRLLKLAAESTEGDDLDAVWEAVFAAHFERNENLGDPAILSELVSQWGLDDSEIQRTLAGERFTDEVAGDLKEARRLSVASVPTVIASNGQRLSGNVSVDELTRFLVTAGSLR